MSQSEESLSNEDGSSGTDDLFAMLERKEAEREQRWNAATPQVVEGIVGASGVAGFGREGDRELGFSLHSWRTQGGALEDGLLYIHFPVSDAEYERLWELIVPWCQLRLLVTIDPENAVWNGRLRADARGQELLEDGLDDREFNEIVERLRLPVAIHDPVLGELVLNRARGLFEGKRHTQTGSYEISTQAAPDDTCDVQALRDSVELVEASVDRIRDAIAEEYFDLYHSWGSPLGKLTAEQFKAKPILVSLEADELGVELYFDDAGLFLGHVFSLRIRDGEVTRVSLEG